MDWTGHQTYSCSPLNATITILRNKPAKTDFRKFTINLGNSVVAALGAEAQSRFTGHIPKLTLEVKAAPEPAAT